MHYGGIVWPDSHSFKQLFKYNKPVCANWWCVGFKIFGLNKASIAIKIISPESLCLALSKYVANPCEPFSVDFCIEANGSYEIF